MPAVVQLAAPYPSLTDSIWRGLKVAPVAALLDRKLDQSINQIGVG